MTDREKLIKLLCEANSKSVDAELFEDSSYAQQLEIEADFLIANGVTFAKDNNVPGWIPVTERLPEEYGRYLCNVKAFAFPGCFYHAILQFDKYGFREGNIYTVAHWMPLPEPPMEV